MRVLVCEYVTGGGMCGMPLSPSLRREGDLMLGALVKDLARIPQVTVVSTRDSRLPPPDLPIDFEVVERPDDVWPTWRRMISRVDALWPIAPESNGALERLSELALEQGRILIGCEPAAVRLAASKRRTAERLAEFGVPVVATRAPDSPPPAEHGWVVKPDDGAGCEDTHLLAGRAELTNWLGRADGSRTYVLQPYLPGRSISLSLLCRTAKAWLLSCNRQNVVLDNGRFRYLGGTVGIQTPQWAVYERIAARVAEAIPGLWGYVGIDLVESADGPIVLEVNPRLTTSYVGLGESLGVNLAALVLDLLQGTVPPIQRTSMRPPVETLVEVGHA